MGLFGSNKPRVSKQEFRDVRSHLYANDFTERQVNHVAMIFRADLDETSDLQRGIDTKEIDRGIKWMREHMSVHSVTKKKIDTLDRLLKDEL